MFFNKKNIEKQTAISQERREELINCQNEINEILKKYNCRLELNQTITVYPNQ